MKPIDMTVFLFARESAFFTKSRANTQQSRQFNRPGINLKADSRELKANVHLTDW